MLIYTDTFKLAYFPTIKSHFYERLLHQERGQSEDEEHPVLYRVIFILNHADGVQYTKPAQ